MKQNKTSCDEENRSELGNSYHNPTQYLRQSSLKELSKYNQKIAKVHRFTGSQTWPGCPGESAHLKTEFLEAHANQRLQNGERKGNIQQHHSKVLFRALQCTRSVLGAELSKSNRQRKHTVPLGNWCPPCKAILMTRATALSKQSNAAPQYCPHSIQHVAIQVKGNTCFKLFFLHFPKFSHNLQTNNVITINGVFSTQENWN